MKKDINFDTVDPRYNESWDRKNHVRYSKIR